ncbi:hypothetical protein [Skermania piniformis]|uniref:Secreted protein n=1 Tax=Skermania pinensis TaxID=39122 RepID=A0ABX8S9X9_9ACTN|nr:hypothetical protein [Skermania piniformis]QXQ14663.1 hypothetical protein KV203_04465 [Skermania piniformis]
MNLVRRGFMFGLVVAGSALLMSAPAANADPITDLLCGSGSAGGSMLCPGAGGGLNSGLDDVTGGVGETVGDITDPLGGIVGDVTGGTDDNGGIGDLTDGLLNGPLDGLLGGLL